MRELTLEDSRKMEFGTVIKVVVNNVERGERVFTGIRERDNAILCQHNAYYPPEDTRYFTNKFYLVKSDKPMKIKDLLK